MYLPNRWNGDVVFYAHGIRDVTEPVDLADQDDHYALRDQLGGLGYAVAYSSFSQNGYDIADAVRRTHQLRGLFTSSLGTPRHSYLVGHSLGALVAMELAETYPTQYDGVLPICGDVGGTAAQLAYVVNVRALFDYFYPGLLLGSASEPVPGYSLDQNTIDKIVAAVTSKPTGLAVIASTEQTKLEFRDTGELVTSLINALQYHARGADNVLPFTHGKFPVSNVGVTYSPRNVTLLPLPVLTQLLADVNANILRFDSDRAAAVWAAKYFTPSGNLRLPTLSLHNMWDRLVPHWHEDLLAAAVTNAGATNLLVQRAKSEWGWGHCAIPTADQVQGVADLAAWVTTGTKPMP